MKVKLIDYTGIGNSNKRFAAELLVFTKSTRLNMSPGLMKDIENMSDDDLTAELEYMSNTIPSSWEMVNYTFLIGDVTRAFTHQLVRNRHGSYAQQTMRILDVANFGYETGPSIEINNEANELYENTMANINDVYKTLIEMGADIQDARGVLPTNIHTNIVAKFNLRTIAELATKRASPRTQGEYREWLNLIVDSVLEVHPWAKLFLRNRKHEAAAELDKFIDSVFSCDSPHINDKMHYMKLVDILRS